MELQLSSNSKFSAKLFLGEGTFGKVAKCTNLSTNEEVAIKIIKNARISSMLTRSNNVSMNINPCVKRYNLHLGCT
uniref:Protein kinase domain-containing protein n=1 Tax=Oryzias latipes TaxID=8090 RepID=A0A3B3IJI9_ORYLA